MLKSNSLRFSLARCSAGCSFVLVVYCILSESVSGICIAFTGAVLKSFREEVVAGRLINDIIASLWRVAVGFVLSAILGIPLGLWLGQHLSARQAFVPMLNFFRFLSPLAWIPFAILWFHIGDKPAIFLIFMATFFPLALATMVAVAYNSQHLFSCRAGLSLQRN